jgi:hypothetical protein
LQPLDHDDDDDDDSSDDDGDSSHDDDEAPDLDAAMPPLITEHDVTMLCSHIFEDYNLLAALVS